MSADEYIEATIRTIELPVDDKGTHIIQVGSDFWSKTAFFGIFQEGGGFQTTKYWEKPPKFIVLDTTEFISVF